MSEPDTGVWVYGVCADTAGELAPDLHGVADERVRLVRSEGLAAIVGTVDLARFGEEGLRGGLNDLDRLEAMARAHHDVVGRVAATRTVAPMRLATVYEDDERVREMLVERRSSLNAALQHVRGRQEWGVKAYRTDRPEEERAPRAATGTAYLRQRRAALSARDASRRTAGAGAEALHAQLLPLSVGARWHRPQDRQLSGDDRPMVLNNAYLVQRDRSAAFAGAVRALADQHPELDVELTGPWPPYSFAVIEEEDRQ